MTRPGGSASAGRERPRAPVLRALRAAHRFPRSGDTEVAANQQGGRTVLDHAGHDPSDGVGVREPHADLEVGDEGDALAAPCRWQSGQHDRLLTFVDEPRFDACTPYDEQQEDPPAMAAPRAAIRRIRVGRPVNAGVWEARPAAMAAGPGQVQDAGSSGPGRAAVLQVQERAPGQGSALKLGHLQRAVRPVRRLRSPSSPESHGHSRRSERHQEPRTLRHLSSFS